MKIIALIPARGGSKGIPRKNLRLLGGIPLVSHSIRQARQSKKITRVILSTDSSEIAEVGKKEGAEVPFLRPVSIAQDLSTDYEFVKHALEMLLESEKYVPDLVVQLRPTVPLRQVDVIDQAIQHIIDNPQADSLRSVTSASFTPFKMWNLGQDGFLMPLLFLPKIKEPWNEPRQRLPKTYQHDGYIDIVRPKTIFEQQSVSGNRILPFFLQTPSVDIDCEEDFIEAEKQQIQIGK